MQTQAGRAFCFLLLLWNLMLRKKMQNNTVLAQQSVLEKTASSISSIEF
jgi:hypothetical protein